MLLGVSFALMAAIARQHVDDSDSECYRVVIRHVLSDGTWFRLRFVHGFLSPFYEHPPLFFWFGAAVTRVTSEGFLPWVGVAFGLGTVTLGFKLGRLWLGETAAFLGMLMLAVTDSFFRYQGRVTLDPPLMFVTTAAFYTLVQSQGRTSRVMLGGILVGLGALVKGPPAFAVPMAVFMTWGWMGAKPFKRWLWPALVMLLSAALLPGLFFLFDHVALGGAWAAGYLHHQVLDSLLGRRHDGAHDHGFLVRTLFGRFWPAFPFALVGVAALFQPSYQRSRPPVLALLSWAFVFIFGFSLAGRAFWHYLLPAYVPLALVAGFGATCCLQVLPQAVRAWLPRALGVGALVFAALCALSPARLLGLPECPVASLVRALDRRAPRPEPVGLLLERPDFFFTTVFSGHAHREVTVVSSWEEARTHADIRWWVIRTGTSGIGAPAQESQGGWSLLELPRL